jgi:transcriptional activator protein UGA3
MNGGLCSFVGTKSLQWLASNFAYHDLLAASTCARNTHFKPAEYETLMRRGATGGSPDSLIGCCQAIFQLLSEVSNLAVEVQALYASMGADDMAQAKLKGLRLKAQVLEGKIEQCTPNHLSILTLTPADMERQLELFECFQLAAKVHLYQSVLRMNASSMDMQITGGQLLRCVDSILGSGVEASIIFPLFLAGICCCTEDSRETMRERFGGYLDRNLAQNINRTLNLLEEVWRRDEFGTKHIHWYSIIETRGWDICFA